MADTPSADDDLSQLPSLGDVIRTHGLQARKSLGQNFLLDGNLLSRIARVPGKLQGKRVYEVGPGPGGLSRAILGEGAASLTAVEADPRCWPILDTLSAASGGRLRLVRGDALKQHEPELMGVSAQMPPGDKPHIIANLPYNIGTPLLIRWLTGEPWPVWWQSLTLMFQKEVADRIVAAPGSEAYGRLSVLAQWRCTARIAFTVPRQAFLPPPKVTSAVVHITPAAPPDDGPAKAQALERVTASAFGQRRKMLRSALRTLTPDCEQLLERAGIDPTRRAESLTIAEFARLAARYEAGQTVIPAD